MEEHHRRLAIRLGGEFTRLVMASLPRFAGAMTQKKSRASITVTVEFTRSKDGDLVCLLKPKESLMIEPEESIKIVIAEGQLSLFEGEPNA